jgi:transposase-like protein
LKGRSEHVSDDVRATPSGETNAVKMLSLLRGGVDVERVRIALLRPADSPRLEGENSEHTQMLAESPEKLPPIVVHRQTMRIIDGVHRMSAALVRGEDSIDVRYFDGTEREAFVLAVRTNTTHGLPLSKADRHAAAARIITSHPEWSDRAISASTGLAPRTISRIRVRLATEYAQPSRREGRDGRMRPLDGAEGRLRASQIIAENPDASLREIARQAGISPTTARDVRELVRSGQDPRRPRNRAHAAPASSVPSPRSAEPTVDRGRMPSVYSPQSTLECLRNDPQLRFTDSGRKLLRWLASHIMGPRDRRHTVAKIPPHCAYLVAELARHFADEWLRLADELEDRARQTV